MIRKLFVVFGTIGIFVLCFGFISVLGSLRPQPEKKEPVTVPPSVFYETVAAQPVNLEVYAQGEVQPKTEIALTTQVSGKIASISEDFEDGGVIEKGQMLVKIEDEDYRLAVTQANARVAQAAQALKLEQAESELALQDWKELGGEESGVEPSSLTLREPQLNQARANYASAEADLRNAQLSLKRTTIRAPFNGRVRQKNADIGQFVSPGMTVGNIFSTDTAIIRLPLADTDLAKLGLPLAFVETDNSQGPTVRLTALVAGQQRTWKGRVVRTDAAIDPRTRQISAIVEVEDPYGAGADNGFPLAMGLFVDAAISGQELPVAFIIPASALQSEDQVFVIAADDTIDVRQVNVVATTTRGLVVTSGLEDGDKLVVARLPGGGKGTKIVPLDRDNPNDPPAAAATPAVNVAGAGEGTAQ
jgi:RND family efflux transporter MFP subunit